MLKGMVLPVELPPKLLGPVGAEVALVDGDHQRPVGHELSQQPAGPQTFFVEGGVLVVHKSSVDASVPEVEVVLQNVGDGFQRGRLALEVEGEGLLDPGPLEAVDALALDVVMDQLLEARVLSL